jgi:hypothetical protein
MKNHIARQMQLLTPFPPKSSAGRAHLRPATRSTASVARRPAQCPPCSPALRLVAQRIDPRKITAKLTTTTPAMPFSLPDPFDPCLPAYPNCPGNSSCSGAQRTARRCPATTSSYVDVWQRSSSESRAHPMENQCSAAVTRVRIRTGDRPGARPAREAQAQGIQKLKYAPIIGSAVCIKLSVDENAWLTSGARYRFPRYWNRNPRCGSKPQSSPAP